MPQFLPGNSKVAANRRKMLDPTKALDKVLIGKNCQKLTVTIWLRFVLFAYDREKKAHPITIGALQQMLCGSFTYDTSPFMLLIVFVVKIEY